MKEVLLAIAIGAASGAVAALCGVGGGIIMVPLFVLLLGLSQKTAVATSLAAIIITALLATAKNQANAFVDWKIAIPCALAGGIVAWFSADALKHLSNAMLTRIFAIVMIAVGVHMLLKKA